MDEQVTIDLDQETSAALRKQAELHGRSLSEEASSIVRKSVDPSSAADARVALIERARAFRESLPPQKTDSLTLLREDRDR